jgi:hypothetical protein
MPQFPRDIGIDYSGAGTADSSYKGLRVYVAGTGERRTILAWNTIIYAQNAAPQTAEVKLWSGT